MYDAEAIRLVRSNWRQLLPQFLHPAKAKVNGEASYICPFCSHGRHGDGLTFDPRSPGRLHCFGPCGWSGDVIDLYRAMYSCSFEDAITALQSMSDALPMINSTSVSLEDTVTEYGEFISLAQRSFIGSPAELYLVNRGISTRTAVAGGAGFCKDWRHPRAPISVSPSPRLIIPTSLESYLARDIRPADALKSNERKYTKQKVGRVHLYCSKGAQSTVRPVFIVEGELDALSLMELGKEAIALGSVSCVNLCLRVIADGPRPSHPFVIALDNDSAGMKASTKLICALQDQGLVAIDGRWIAGQCKDVNEALISERDELENRIELIEQQTMDVFLEANSVREHDRPRGLRIISTNEYLQEEYAKDVAKFSTFSNRRTGFSNIDNITGFYPGLYAVGGISSLGKTTFVHQLADQLASNGEHVLYFPIEQTPMELVSKGISRTMYRNDPSSAISSIQLRSGYINAAVALALEKYKQRCYTLCIAECSFATTAVDIKNTVYEYAYRTATSPIVIVDYLQALQSSGEEHLGQREAVDLSLRIFKDMQADLAATVIVVSSLNRANYLTPIGFESFKESGGIEYTCDVVWGIDLVCMDEHIFDIQGHVQAKREMIKSAKVANPRKVRLVCLKNRFGISSYSVSFDYFPGYDTFIPLDDNASLHSVFLDGKDELPFSPEDQAALTRAFLSD